VFDRFGGVLGWLTVAGCQGGSTCYDECETNWPIVAELSTVGGGLVAELVGTTERTTGDTQATYNGWPLYYFAGDAAAGDTNGQGVNDVWYVLDAEGNAVGAG
jgi:predicted lipoprotein with Yx(FWY)xxD motif